MTLEGVYRFNVRVKQGRIAKSIRTVVKAAASKGDKKVIVDIK